MPAGLYRSRRTMRRRRCSRRRTTAMSGATLAAGPGARRHRPPGVARH